MSKFKVGDKVRCVVDDSHFLTEGRIYEVLDIADARFSDYKTINVVDDTGDRHARFYSYKFELVQDVTPFSELKHWKQEALRMHYDGKPHGVIAEALGKPYFTITTHLHILYLHLVLAYGL